MKKLQNHLIGIDQGDVVLFSDFDSGGEMWKGSGPRESRKAVRFSKAFRSAPAVQVSVSLWDVDTGPAMRAEIVAEEITPEGCTLVFRTWSDSRIARLRAAWMAIGEVPHEDDWDLY